MLLSFLVLQWSGADFAVEQRRLCSGARRRATLFRLKMELVLVAPKEHHTCFLRVHRYPGLPFRVKSWVSVCSCQVINGLAAHTGQTNVQRRYYALLYRRYCECRRQRKRESKDSDNIRDSSLQDAEPTRHLAYIIPLSTLS